MTKEELAGEMFSLLAKLGELEKEISEATSTGREGFTSFDQNRINLDLKVSANLIRGCLIKLTQVGTWDKK